MRYYYCEVCGYKGSYSIKPKPFTFTYGPERCPRCGASREKLKHYMPPFKAQK
jgi:rubrerythrin